MPRLRRLSLSAIEALEQRIVPTVTIQAGVDLDADGNADDLKIVGGNETTEVTIEDEGSGAGSYLVSVDINGDDDYNDAGEIENFLVNVSDDSCVIDLQMGGGNDSVYYGLTDHLAFSNRHLSIDLGSGNDFFQLNGNQKSISAGSVVLIDLLAGAGNDSFSFSLPSLSNSDLTIDAIMGSGNDYIQQFSGMGIPKLDSTSYLDMNFDLGSGTNTVDVALLADVGTTSRANLNLDILGGSGIDNVSLINALNVGNGSLGSSAVFNVELGGGNDTFKWTAPEINVAAESTVSVRASGGLGNDTLTIGYQYHVDNAIAGLLQIDLLGGLGNDILTSNLTGSSGPGTILLTGQLRVSLLGQEGNDQLLAELGTSNTSTGNYSLVAMGGVGNDSVAVHLVTNGAGLSYGKFGKLITDGGKGTDSFANLGTPASVVDIRFFETIA